MPSIFEKRFWLYSLLAMIIIGPLTVWGAWDTISSFNSMWLRILMSAGIVLLEFIGGAILFGGMQLVKIIGKISLVTKTKISQ